MNTLAAEVLYSTVADWCQLSENTTLLDVCCGTGTIGLTMAKVRVHLTTYSAFPKHVSSNAKAGKTLFYLKKKKKKNYLGLLHPPIHQSDCPTKARTVLE